MGTDRGARVKSIRRPKKRGCEKKRRQKVQARRLAALGVSEAKIKGMTPLAVRELLKRPARIKR